MDKFEKAGEKIREKIRHENGSNSSERILVSEFVSDVFDESGSHVMMIASLNEIMDACKLWKEFLEALDVPEGG